KTIFMIRAKKAGKEFPLGSMEVNKQVGAHLVGALGYTVDLEHPEIAFYIEIVNQLAFVYTDKDVVQGVGGLPTGSSGKVICLLSGGIDSPVAAYYLMRRGCSVTFVHFYNASITSEAALEKVKDLVRVLTPYQLRSTLQVVPFTALQNVIIEKIPADYRMILYRRFMLRIAEALACKEGAGALLTGENLAQVASQTLENLNTISAVTPMQIFRPLIGFDKDDIIKIARKIGTYEISIQPYGDCCSYMIAEHPQTKAKLPAVEQHEKKLDVQKLVSAALKATKKEEFKI
ncbi:MAG: tRNA uracil 4-sulfurtransferase ThiI, partial [Nanoarchaeota archaeon]